MAFYPIVSLVMKEAPKVHFFFFSCLFSHLGKLQKIQAKTKKMCAKGSGKGRQGKHLKDPTIPSHYSDWLTVRNVQSIWEREGWLQILRVTDPVLGLRFGWLISQSSKTVTGKMWRHLAILSSRIKQTTDKKQWPIITIKMHERQEQNTGALDVSKNDSAAHKMVP